MSIWGEDFNPYDTASHDREPGCLCHWEEGDSPCPVHGDDPPEDEVAA